MGAQRAWWTRPRRARAGCAGPPSELAAEASRGRLALTPRAARRGPTTPSWAEELASPARRSAVQTSRARFRRLRSSSCAGQSSRGTGREGESRRVDGGGTKDDPPRGGGADGRPGRRRQRRGSRPATCVPPPSARVRRRLTRRPSSSSPADILTAPAARRRPSAAAHGEDGGRRARPTQAIATRAPGVCLTRSAPPRPRRPARPRGVGRVMSLLAADPEAESRTRAAERRTGAKVHREARARPSRASPRGSASTPAARRRRARRAPIAALRGQRTTRRCGAAAAARRDEATEVDESTGGGGGGGAALRRRRRNARLVFRFFDPRRRHRRHLDRHCPRRSAMMARAGSPKRHRSRAAAPSPAAASPRPQSAIRRSARPPRRRRAARRRARALLQRHSPPPRPRCTPRFSASSARRRCSPPPPPACCSPGRRPAASHRNDEARGGDAATPVGVGAGQRPRGRDGGSRRSASRRRPPPPPRRRATDAGVRPRAPSSSRARRRAGGVAAARSRRRAEPPSRSPPRPPPRRAPGRLARPRRRPPCPRRAPRSARSALALTRALAARRGDGPAARARASRARAARASPTRAADASCAARAPRPLPPCLPRCSSRRTVGPRARGRPTPRARVVSDADDAHGETVLGRSAPSRQLPLGAESVRRAGVSELRFAPSCPPRRRRGEAPLSVALIGVLQRQDDSSSSRATLRARSSPSSPRCGELGAHLAREIDVGRPSARAHSQPLLTRGGRSRTRLLLRGGVGAALDARRAGYAAASPCARRRSGRRKQRGVSEPPPRGPVRSRRRSPRS